MTKAPRRKSPDSNTGFPSGSADIIRGAKNNDLNEVSAALEDNAGAINQQDGAFGLTALHIASSKGNASMVQYLIDQDGLDSTIVDRWGRSALDVAILAGEENVVRLLFTLKPPVQTGNRT